jgi:hypothetical protein
MRDAAVETHVVLGADHEKGPALMDSVQSREVEVSTVHDVDGPGLYGHLVQNPYIVKLAMSNDDHTGDVAVQVQQGVQFDSPLALAEFGPWEKSQAKIDHCGIQGVDGLLQIEAEILLGIQESGCGMPDNDR